MAGGLCEGGRSYPGKRQLVAYEHEHTNDDEGGRQEDFSPEVDGLLRGEDVLPASNEEDKHCPQHRIGQHTARRVEQTTQEGGLAVFQLSADIADGGDVGGHRAGANGREQAEQEGR